MNLIFGAAHTVLLKGTVKLRVIGHKAGKIHLG